MATTTHGPIEVAMTITTENDRHGTRHTYIEMPELPHLIGKLSSASHGSWYLILNLRTGRNTHPGVRVDNTKSEPELLAQMAEEMITHIR